MKPRCPIRALRYTQAQIPDKAQIVELHPFDEVYVNRLRSGDPAVQQHFCAYFGELVQIKLRSRLLPRHVIEDIRQETFLRVLMALQRDGIEQPERLGAFVNSVCNHVLFEQYRFQDRTESLEPLPEPPDHGVDLDRTLLSEETRRQVEQVLRGLGQRDRDLLRAVFLEEKSREQVCRELGVDREYLRVLLHRAKSQFRAGYGQSRPS